MGRKWWIVGVLGAAVVIAGGLVLARRGPHSVAVDLETTARREAFRSYVTASGEIVATSYADIGSSVMGKIVSLTVAEGDRVKAGQVLAHIDPVQAQSEAAAAEALVQAIEADTQAGRKARVAASADLEQVRARLSEADSSFRRQRDLADQGLVTAAQLDTARAAADATAAQVAAAQAAVSRAEQAEIASERRVAQARAQFRRAQDILSKTAVVAPISGIVSRLRVREGEMVVIGIQNQPGTTLMTISDLSAIDAEVKVAEADVLRVAVGQRARVTLEAAAGRVFPGRVVEIGASALPVVGTAAAAREFRVVVRLDQPDSNLRPGLTCDAEILTGERRNVLTVPLQAVVLRPAAGVAGDRAGVFTVKDGRAVFVPILTGIIGGLDVEVSGLPEGVQVVVGPFQFLRGLRDGTP
ncbi:MAG: efflux RND transporter periplasmic adaptor subunit, partial [Planctomycetes bacterium]|nr:efflux RND transporter periplasmic adaptor subunit [Planctomycetota bacterium]